MSVLTSDDETARLDTLYRYGILDTPAEQAFDDLAALAASLCGTPIALVSLIDKTRQWFKAKVGLTVSETPREHALCAYAIRQPHELFVVPDAATDERFATNPFVIGGPRIRFYAGAPLTTAEGHALGTLCVIDRVPRTLTAEQIEGLRLLARQVVSQLKLHRKTVELERVNAERLLKEEALRESEERYASIFQHALDGIFLVGVRQDGAFFYESFNPALEQQLGLSSAVVHGKSPEECFPAETAAHITARYRACVEAGQPIHYDEEVELLVGIKSFHTILVPIQNASGHIFRLVGITRHLQSQTHGRASPYRS